VTERPPHWRRRNRTKHLLSRNVDPLAFAGAAAFWQQKFEASVKEAFSLRGHRQ